MLCFDHEAVGPQSHPHWTDEVSFPRPQERRATSLCLRTQWDERVDGGIHAAGVREGKGHAR